MALRWYTVVVDCLDVAAQAEWWRDTLGWQTVYAADDEVVIVPAHVTPEVVAATPWEQVGPGLVFVPVEEGKAGVPTYVHNFVGMQSMAVSADAPIGPGDHVLELRFDYDGGGAGKGGTASFTCDGEAIGSGRIDRTVPGLFSFDEGLDIGFDSLDPVVDDYATPKGRFTGTIDTVIIDIDPNAHHDPDLVVKQRYRRQ